jgi:polysaccharide deacetylase family protein (PEP-CTERM system associated)
MSRSVSKLLVSPAGAVRQAPENTRECVFTVDVEDWFHILQLRGAPALSEWEAMPSRVESNFLRLLDLLSEQDAHATCFFLGWIAERFPGLVREAGVRGHEIASHGYAHRLVFEMSMQGFRNDAIRAREILEDISGRRVLGYRSAGFSGTKRGPWFFDALLEAGYAYDSSSFPARRRYGGAPNGRRDPYQIACRSGVLTEFPVSVADFLGVPLCFFGGGYLRLFPYWLIRRMAGAVLDEGRPVVFYIHPREIDPEQPRLEMPLHRRFLSYVNLETTEAKLRRIAAEFSLITVKQYIGRYQGQLETQHAA